MCAVRHCLAECAVDMKQLNACKETDAILTLFALM